MCEDCVLCFSEDNPGDFSPRGVFLFVLKIPPPTFELPPGRLFSEKNIHPTAGGSQRI